MLEHDIRLDLERQARLGFDEAIYAEGKSAGQLRALAEDALATGSRRLFTRLSIAQFDALPAELRARLDFDPVSRTAVLDPRAQGKKQQPGNNVPPHVAVVCAGSSDATVSREALRTLEYYGYPGKWFPDVGVAGLWRLLEHIEELRSMQVVIVAAGMDGALPSVVGGLVPGVVIALPTSVGYGAGAGGKAALAAALSSCAPGVVVVNIDNGYGAACAAVRVLRQSPSAGQPAG